MKSPSLRAGRTRSAVGAMTAVAAAVVLAACGSSNSSSSGSGSSSSSGSSSGGTIKFGFLNALSGAYAVAGGPELNGAKLAVKDINASGGVCGKQMALGATADDQGQANLSVAGLRKLAQQDNLSYIIGPGITPPGLADGPIAESLKVWFMVQTAQRQPWQGRTYVSSSVTPQDVEGRLVFNYMKNNGFNIIDKAPRPGSRGTTVFFVHPKSRNDNPFGFLIEVVEDPNS